MFGSCMPEYNTPQASTSQHEVPDIESPAFDRSNILSHIFGWKASTGFGSTSTAAEVVQPLNLRGKVFLITGASAPIGFQTADALLNAGASLILVCRTIEKGQDLAVQLCKYHPDADINIIECDLSSLASVESCAEAVQALDWPVHCIIHSAAVMAVPFQLTQDDFELHWAVNYVAPYLLTRLLMPLLLSSAAELGQEARVVFLACHYHYFTYRTGPQKGRGINFRRVESQKAAQNYTPMEAFAQSKLALILLAKELQRRLLRSPIPVEVFAVHPGITADGFSRSWGHQPGSWVQYFKDSVASAAEYMRAIKTPEQAAATVAYCAAHPSATGCSGSYWVDCTPARPSRPARDELAPTLLWQLTDEALQRRNMRLDDVLASVEPRKSFQRD